MIRGKDIYDVMSATVPLYVAMFLAYGSVRWWRVFTPDQCSGINRFVAVFAVPLLSFHFISSNNPYSMNYHFIAADSLQKLVILSALFLYHHIAPRHSRALDWSITLFSLSTLPNTLVMGIPLLRAMYGDFSGSLMVQIVVLQSVIWYTFMLVIFEYRAARALIADQFSPDVARSIASFHVESDVVSLAGGAAAPLHMDANIGTDGRLHVVVLRDRSATPSLNNSSYNNYNNNNNSKSVMMTPRASNLTGMEIYSLQSSREPTPRGSSFNQSEFCSMFSAVPAAMGPLDEEVEARLGKQRAARSRSGDFLSTNFGGKSLKGGVSSSAGANNVSSKELHMYVWSASSASPVSEANLRMAVNRAASADFGAMDQPSNKSALHLPDFPSSRGLPLGATEGASPIRKGGHAAEPEDGLGKTGGLKFSANGSPYLDDASATTMKKEAAAGNSEGSGLQVEEIDGHDQMPPASVMTRLILIMVWRKLIRNPNTYSSLIGLIWSLVSYRWNIEMPAIIQGSVSILSNAGLGMAMFSLGLFMALQPKLIACGKSVAAFSMAVRFLTGPAVIAATSIAIGLRGVLLHIAIVQAALPQGIVPFVFAKEYSCHPDILSTGVIFGMLVALPITILYYVLLGL